jgi:hypothetical protein
MVLADNTLQPPHTWSRLQVLEGHSVKFGPQVINFMVIFAFDWLSCLASGGGLCLLSDHIEETPNAKQVPHQWQEPVIIEMPEYLCPLPAEGGHGKCNKAFSSMKHLDAHMKTSEAHVPMSERRE